MILNLLAPGVGMGGGVAVVLAYAPIKVMGTQTFQTGTPTAQIFQTGTPASESHYA